MHVLIDGRNVRTTGISGRRVGRNTGAHHNNGGVGKLGRTVIQHFQGHRVSAERTEYIGHKRASGIRVGEVDTFGGVEHPAILDDLIAGMLVV